jgi:hypothetical protein
MVMMNRRYCLLALVIFWTMAVPLVAQEDDAIELTHAATVEDDLLGVALTLNLPDGWIAESSVMGGALRFANSQTALDVVTLEDFSLGLESGTVGGAVTYTLSLHEDGGALEELESQAEFLKLSLFNQPENTFDKLQFDEAQTFTAEGRDGAYIIGSAAVEENVGDVILMIVEAGDHYALFIVSAKKGEAEDYVAVLQAMAGAVEITPIEDDAEIRLTETISVENEFTGNLTMYYPKGWVVRDASGLIYLDNSESALDRVEADEAPMVGDVGGFAVGVPAEAISSFVADDDRSVADILNAMTERLSGEEFTFELGEIEEFTVNGRNGAIVTGTGTDNGNTVDVLFAGVFEGEDFIILVMRSNVGEMGQYIEIAKAMVGAAEFEFEAP